MTPQSLVTPLKFGSHKIWVGTSGYSYDEWRGVFYPPDLSSKKFLSYYAQHFITTEINNTFYRLPTPKLVMGWQAEVPEEFRFTLKASQAITHRKKLKDVDEEMGLFLNAARVLGDKLAVILVQLPPFFRKDLPTLNSFLQRFAPQANLAFEFRHKSWMSDDVRLLLDEHRCTLAVVETEEKSPLSGTHIQNGPLVYMRLRKGEYDRAELQGWADWILAQKRDVYCYLKHDQKAPVLAQQLLDLLLPSADHDS